MDSVPGWEDPLNEVMATHSSILAGESHGQRSMAGYSSWGCKELDTTEATEHAHMHGINEMISGDRGYKAVRESSYHSVIIHSS